MRSFYSDWEICQTLSGKFEARVKGPMLSGKSQAGAVGTWSAQCEAPEKVSTLSRQSGEKEGRTPVPALADVFPLSWSRYVRLMSVENPRARAFYEAEAIRGGWSVRQLDRQIGTRSFDRILRSKRPLRGGTPPAPVEDEIRDPYLLEFLDLKDEYGETDLEEALVRRLEEFLLEMGAGFTFVARQKRIRVGGSWYRIDLLLYHRGLRCLVVVDLKTGAFTHADAGQMNLYLNYVRERLKMPGEADPVGIILCSEKDDAVVKYATGGVRTRVFASKYMTRLPGTETLRREIVAARRAIRARRRKKPPPVLFPRRVFLPKRHSLR